MVVCGPDVAHKISLYCPFPLEQLQGAASQFSNNCSSFSAPSASRWSKTTAGCGVSSVGSVWNPPGSSPEQHTLADSPLSRTTQFPVVPFYFMRSKRKVVFTLLPFYFTAWVAAVQLSGGGGEPGAGEKSFCAGRKRKWVKALPETKSTEDGMVQNY